MDTIIKEGNKIDVFGILMGGSMTILLFFLMRPSLFNYCFADKDFILVYAVAFLLLSYGIGLLELELGRYLEKFPLFRFYRSAKREIYIKGKGISTENLDKLVKLSGGRSKESDYKNNNSSENSEEIKTEKDQADDCHQYLLTFLRTKGYSEVLTRYFAYYTMSRSMILSPVLIFLGNLVFNLENIEITKKIKTEQLFVPTKILKCISYGFYDIAAWKWFILIPLSGLFYFRARRFARHNVKFVTDIGLQLINDESRPSANSFRKVDAGTITMTTITMPQKTISSPAGPELKAGAGPKAGL